MAEREADGADAKAKELQAENQANGHLDPESSSPPQRSVLSALIQDFSPVWVTWSMNTGILALLMHTLPYQFHGLKVISTVLFVTDLVIFIICSILMSLRFLRYRWTAWAEITSDVNELCFMSCFPIAWMTLTSLTSLIVSNAYWGGHAFTVVAYVMWWISVGWTLSFGIGIYIILTLKPLTKAYDLSLSIILPAVATSTAAAVGGFLANYSAGLSARLAIPVIIMSFMLVGIGFFVAMMVFALLLQRILANSWFDAVRRPSLVILLGPVGQSATALLALSTASTTHFADYGKGPFLQQDAAMALHGSCVLFALMMFGLGIFWVVYAVYGILDAVVRKQAKWTPAWYSTIFPSGQLPVPTNWLLLT